MNQVSQPNQATPNNFEEIAKDFFNNFNYEEFLDIFTYSASQMEHGGGMPINFYNPYYAISLFIYQMRKEFSENAKKSAS